MPGASRYRATFIMAMSTKKNISKTPKTKAKAGRTKKGTFKKGNKAAEKWTETYTLEVLGKMWDKLTEGHEDAEGNFVRANDIKTLAEVCLMQDLDPDTWAYIKERHTDLQTKSVLRAIKKIEWVLETRLIYSGQAMDMFVLKNRYGFTDVRQQEIGNIPGQTFQTDNKQKIDYSKLPDAVLDALIAATTSQDEE